LKKETAQKSKVLKNISLGYLKKMGNVDTIIITGSSRGIGAAIGKEWSKSGVKNNANYGYYGISKWNDLDVTNYKKIENYMTVLFYDLKKHKRNLPIALINNAGIVKVGSIFETDINDWKYQFDVNVHGLFNCSKIYSKLCIKYKIPGKIINISSTAGLGARAGRAAYSASKAAVINFSLSMAEELKPYNIKVYCVCPGACDTDMRHYINPDDNFKSMMKPNEIGKFVIDLIVDGKFLDGQILEVKR
jgi:NAD(P)-dependent dehydrogenase (short-subunit alcohol dehydrogenase family)